LACVRAAVTPQSSSLLITVSFCEACKFIKSALKTEATVTLMDVKKYLTTATQSALDSMAATCPIFQMVLQTGDVVHIPAGYVICEKCLSTVSMSLCTSIVYKTSGGKNNMDALIALASNMDMKKDSSAGAIVQLMKRTASAMEPALEASVASPGPGNVTPAPAAQGSGEVAALQAAPETPVVHDVLASQSQGLGSQLGGDSGVASPTLANGVVATVLEALAAEDEQLLGDELFPSIIQDGGGEQTPASAAACESLLPASMAASRVRLRKKQDADGGGKPAEPAEDGGGKPAEPAEAE
jgi:hypothetical protein